MDPLGTGATGSRDLPDVGAGTGTLVLCKSSSCSSPLSSLSSLVMILCASCVSFLLRKKSVKLLGHIEYEFKRKQYIKLPSRNVIYLFCSLRSLCAEVGGLAWL